MSFAPPPFSELLDAQSRRVSGVSGPDIYRAQDFVPYLSALAWMDQRAAAVHAQKAPEALWLLEHPPLYTAGTSAKASDLLAPDRFPVYPTGRGGEFTYHGPGQRVVYVVLDLNKRGRDIRRFIKTLETWIIEALSHSGVAADTRQGRVGVWVETPASGVAPRQEQKIAAIGVRVRKWIAFHGIAVNISPTLEHFDGIVPCGLSGYGVTSLHGLGLATTMAEFDQALLSCSPFQTPLP